MDAYTLELKKLLADHQAPQVMKSLIETLEVASKSSSTLKFEIEPLQSEMIMLSSRLTRINRERSQNLIDQTNFGIELARIEKSILGTLNGLDENYPGLEAYFLEREEDAAWATASASNDIETYQAFFNKYPNGKYREETQRLIEELKTLEVQKNVAFRKTAEAERKRRQSTQEPQKPKTKQSDTRYILMVFGVFTLLVIGYFVMDSFNKPNKPTVERLTEENNPSIESDEKEPEKPIAVKQPLKLTSGKQILGTWKSSQGTLRLMASGSRIYGEMGRTTMIEAVLDVQSEIIKGARIEGQKSVPFIWMLEGWTLNGKETWVFTDRQTNASWTGEKIDSKTSTLQHFIWGGTWETNLGDTYFKQKGTTITGAVKGKSISGRLKGTYNSMSRKITGQIISGSATGSFDIQLTGRNSFSGTSNLAIKMPLIGTKKIPSSWTGKKIK